ncbi:type IV pilin N-terminal domain-containing protein [Halorussus limi]|uniref:Type IV pilin N-terminal domain-containing protein n=1 Tax=Halorussus limi TaxID=2938695 RepID=A0A8U0HXH6_9EURY|nr:type IV pilin [Halorussus limi]UPV75832.1 type IV pilin N-terminal domain-containing protein [Halorussus limi]
MPTDEAFTASDRGTSPVLGVVLLLVVTAIFAGAVGSIALGTPMPSDSPRAAIDLRLDADANRVTLVHRGGAALDVNALSIRVRVDGTALDAQPPVPFFSTDGFRSGPTGPFNSAADQQWTAGETASFALAETNDPVLSSGVTVEVMVSVDGTVVAEMEGTA